jgi:phage tail-like protein
MAPSTYLDYLPPVLWTEAGPQPQITLGDFLNIFEKLLTGIDDGVPVAHGGHQHVSVRSEIQRLPELFDPWRTPDPAWLASWVALELPRIWTDYQRRKLIGEIVGIYQARGVRDSLAQYLELYTVAATRPRIAIDDSSRVLEVELAPGREGRFTTLVSQGPSRHERDYGAAGSETLYQDGPVHPICGALAPNGDLLLGDYGTPPNVGVVINSNVWRLAPNGEYGFTGTPPKATPVTAQSTVPNVSWSPYRPVGLAVAASGTTANSPWALYVLDQVPGSTAIALYKLTAPAVASSAFTLEAALTRNTLQLRYPVGLTVMQGSRLAILDRGFTPGGAAGPPKIVRVDIGVSPPAFIAQWTYAGQLTEPLAIAALSNGDLVVADARDQLLSGPAQLFRVDATTGTLSAPLLPTGVTQNTLACPAALLAESDTSILVADAGLKPFNPATPLPMAKMAEPAAIYRVTIPPAPVTVTRVTEPGRLVFPTALLPGTPAIRVVDRGGWSPAIAPLAGHTWRAWPAEFGIHIRFSELRPAAAIDRGRIVNDIAAIVNRERPAHTQWSLVYRI